MPSHAAFVRREARRTATGAAALPKIQLQDCDLKPRFFPSKIISKLAIAAAATLALSCAGADISSAGLSLHVDGKSGSYELSEKEPAWDLSGSVEAPLKNLTTSRGHDAIGNFRLITFDWQADEKPMSGSIRLYEGEKLAVFSQTCGTAMEMPPGAFPDFKKLPDQLHIFSYQQRTFSPPRFGAVDTSTPWLFFDDSAHAFIISPASHLMVASMMGDGRTEAASGFNPNLRHLPAGFTQQTLVAFGAGINRTWDAWGRALVALGGAKRPANDADATLKYLGYWTDNGAGYYYNYDLDKGYAGTLEALVERYRQEQIPIHYLQLDSWWYYKTTTDTDGKQGKAKKSDKLPEGEWNRYGGLLEYKAHPALFPNGLEAFQKTIGLPLVTHNRWIDPASPYHQHYKISGVAAVDPKWWDDIAAYLKTSGIVTYEQDWLDHIYIYSPEFSSTVGTGEAFLDNMSRACREQGITLQYCMPLPCHFLQGSRYPNLTTIRTSGDRFSRNNWNDFLYVSRLAASAGIWPWTDVFMSTERNNMLLATLSAGPVGIGDLMGAETKTNIFRAVRADGVIVKPDAAIVPMDQSYLADANKESAPLMASTFTDRNGIKTEYVFAFDRKGKPGGEVSFKTSELGVSGPAYVYDYFSGSGKRVDVGATFSAPLAENAAAFYVVAPVGNSGIAFLGDEDKFVGTGKQRITSLRDETGKLTAEVALAKGENLVVLHGYSAQAPTATVNGMNNDVQYDAATGHFTVEVKADPAAPTDDTTGDPVRKATVVISAIQ
jgi:hypothetical protein